MRGVIWIVCLFGSWLVVAGLISMCRRIIFRKSAEIPAAEKTMRSGEVPRVSAEEMWAAARKIPHGYAPNWVKDARYLNLVYGAAEGGGVDAMEKLGRYARRHGLLVEAYYWTLLADLHGRDERRELAQIFDEWMSRGCRREHSNVTEHFSRRQGSLTRALLRIRGGFHTDESFERVRSYAASGMKDAQMALARETAGVKEG